MEATIRAVLARVHVTYPGVDGQPIEGFFPGPTYSYESSPGRTPFNLYIRDTATDLPMARYYYGAPALRSTVEEFLRLQYADGVDFGDRRARLQSRQSDGRLRRGDQHHPRRDRGVRRAARSSLADPEPARPDAGRALEPRHGLGAERSAATPRRGLIKRAHTTDWGDIKWESNSDPSHMRPGDQWTVSIYDQAIAYAALQGLARLNAAAGARPGSRAVGRRRKRAAQRDQRAAVARRHRPRLLPNPSARCAGQRPARLRRGRRDRHWQRRGRVLRPGGGGQSAAHSGRARASAGFGGRAEARADAHAALRWLVPGPDGPAHVPERCAVGLVGRPPGVGRILERLLAHGARPPVHGRARLGHASWAGTRVGESLAAQDRR